MGMGPEEDPDDFVTLRCDRCSEEVPWHDAVLDGEPPSVDEAKRARAARDWINALCSWCNHMQVKLEKE